MRRLLWRLLGLADDPRPPGAPLSWPDAARWRPVPFVLPHDEVFIDLFGPAPDDGSEPGDFQRRDR